MIYSLKDVSTYGKGSYGRPRVLTWGNDSKFIVGKYCSIAGEVNLLLQAEHRTDWVTTYPFSVKLSKHWPEVHEIEGHPTTKGDIVVGNDVWIGWGVTLMSGITIGDGAVIGAYSVVGKDIPPYWVVAGNPIRMIRPRFSNLVINRLLKIKWWDWPDEKIRTNIRKLCGNKVAEFVAEFENDK